MNSIDFCFWLQGFFEISGSDEMTDEQVKIVKNHLNLTFVHEIDPLREKQTTATLEELNDAHTGKPELPKFNKIPPSGNDTKYRC